MLFSAAENYTGESIEDLLAGSKIALARIISVVENEPTMMAKFLPQIQPKLGRAHCIGITGPPGAGKSSLVNQLIKIIRARNLTVGVIAIDPSSPFTGGAFLGDRVRMQDHYVDSGVFIRSMSTRGEFGGLSRATKAVVKLMDAFGMDYILVETVGVGQTEVNIIESTDTVIVELVPEGGDSIQAMKAGLMEIADIFVINKSDRPGAGELAAQIEMTLQMNYKEDKKIPPVLLTQCLDGLGIDELVEQIIKHKAGSHKNVLENRLKERRQREFDEIFADIALAEWKKQLESDSKTREIAKSVIDGTLDPYSALQMIFAAGSILKT